MATSSSAPPRLSTKQRLILGLVLAADVLDLMDSTICNLAAPSIVADLGGGQALLQWLGAAYALAMGALLVLGGRLGDRYGQRRMFLVGLGGFIVASAACGLAFDPIGITIGRVVQGAFGALLLPQGLSLLMSSLRRDQLPVAFSAFGPTMGLAAVLGPIVAGVLISANLAGLHWRPVFLINLVVGVAAFVTAWRVLPRDEPRTSAPIDLMGTIVLSVSLFLLIFGLIEGTSNGVAALGAGIVLLVVFVVRQFSARHPLIKMSLFRNRGFTSGLAIGLGFFAAANGLSYVAALYFQMILHLSPVEASFALAPLLVGIIAASTAGRPLIARWGRNFVLVGLLTTLAGAGLLAATVTLWGAAPSAWAFGPGLFITGLGMGACFGSLFDVALGTVNPEETGSASGTLSAVQQLANALGAAVVTGVYFGQLPANGGGSALQITALTMAILVAVCLALVPLLPPKAPIDHQA